MSFYYIIIIINIYIYIYQYINIYICICVYIYIYRYLIHTCIHTVLDHGGGQNPGQVAAAEDHDGARLR